MSEKMVSVRILGKTKTYPYGTPYAQIVKEYEGITRYPIVLVMKDNKLCELHKKAEERRCIGVCHHWGRNWSQYL